MKDHFGLQYFFYQPWLNVRQANWMEMISEFDFEVKNIKGKRT